MKRQPRLSKLDDRPVRDRCNLGRRLEAAGQVHPRVGEVKRTASGNEPPQGGNNRQASKSWPVAARAGFTVRPIGCGRIRFDFVLRASVATSIRARLVTLDRARLRIGTTGTESGPLRLSSKAQLIVSPEVTRVIQALEIGPLRFAAWELEIPNNGSETQYYGLNVVEDDVHQADPKESRSGRHRSGDEFYVERRKAEFCLGRRPPEWCYGFMMTRAQINRRMAELMELAKRDGLIKEPADAPSTDMLRKIVFHLYGGFDSPVLRKELNDEK